jgi:outer membrane protein assembly factor BamE (lipoprotein component of BamABCDE complex)
MMKKPYQRLLKLIILSICVLAAICTIIGLLFVGGDNSFVSRDGQYGQDLIGDRTIYLYHRSERTVIPDTNSVSLPKFDAVKPGMTREQVRHILGDTIVWKFGTEGFWFASQTAFVRIRFENDRVSDKTRNFDGEHESSERWTRFWRESHQVNLDYRNELDLQPE